jgi:hypothetical protein
MSADRVGVHVLHGGMHLCNRPDNERQQAQYKHELGGAGLVLHTCWLGGGCMLAAAASPDMVRGRPPRLNQGVWPQQHPGSTPALPHMLLGGPAAAHTPDATLVCVTHCVWLLTGTCATATANCEMPDLGGGHTLGPHLLHAPAVGALVLWDVKLEVVAIKQLKQRHLARLNEVPPAAGAASLAGSLRAGC